MRAILTFGFHQEGGGGSSVCKLVELPFMPVVGHQLHDYVWEEPQKVVSATYNISKLYASVHMGHTKTANEKETRFQVEMYQSHGWRELSQAALNEFGIG